ncbi:hypothetical protein [Sphingomonas prati]|uniref:Uncharacterized protein n=1 Tax=Sphingomonas prati TaxID=1843237 RepID=A0A7W9BPE1_9SPHN|nr:hypothetical protein [Sphingomonas prati]MBB5727702.1 hypothetical protein [Sphingomonas prati]
MVDVDLGSGARPERIFRAGTDGEAGSEALCFVALDAGLGVGDRLTLTAMAERAVGTGT